MNLSQFYEMSNEQLAQFEKDKNALVLFYPSEKKEHNAVIFQQDFVELKIFVGKKEIIFNPEQVKALKKFFDKY